MSLQQDISAALLVPHKEQHKPARNKEEGASGTPAAAKEPREAPMPHPKWGRREEPPACRGHVLTPPPKLTPDSTVNGSNQAGLQGKRGAQTVPLSAAESRDQAAGTRLALRCRAGMLLACPVSLPPLPSLCLPLAGVLSLADVNPGADDVVRLHGLRKQRSELRKEAKLVLCQAGEQRG